MPATTEITPAALFRLIGTPDAPVLLDVCIDEDFDADAWFIPGAARRPHDAVAALAPKLQGRRVMVICQKGRKLSQGAAATLRALGVAAETLAGGKVGWREAGLPMTPAAAIPKRDAAGRTVWVTRHRPKIDRIACPWLIRRFIDPAALFLFVAPGEVAAVAENFDAEPFDVADVRFTHRGDPRAGGGCTFDAMVEDFGLAHPALATLAAIIRGADVEAAPQPPQSAGLLAASLGLSRMHRDDLDQLDAAMPLYDALYRWARDAADERHDWTPEAAA